jgi:hypothetical protein
MKRFAILLTATVVLFVSHGSAQAGWGSLNYGGYQPWWNIFAHRNHGMTHEEQRLQRFWHDYYDALRRYYDLLDNIDWVAYYKNHGYQINSSSCGYGGGPCGGSQRIQFAPVIVSPTMGWAVPNSYLNPPPSSPPCPNPAMFHSQQGGGFPPMGGGFPPMGGGFPPQMGHGHGSVAPAGYYPGMPSPYGQPGYGQPNYQQFPGYQQ